MNLTELVFWTTHSKNSFRTYSGLVIQSRPFLITGINYRTFILKSR